MFIACSIFLAFAVFDHLQANYSTANITRTFEAIKMSLCPRVCMNMCVFVQATSWIHDLCDVAHEASRQAVNPTQIEEERVKLENTARVRNLKGHCF